MIITLVKADFSANNIGTLDSFAVLTNIIGGTYNGPTSIAKNEAFVATITLHDNFQLSNSVTVTMGGNLINAVSINDSVITIEIPAVTGVVVINMAAVELLWTDITSLFDFTMFPSTVSNIGSAGTERKTQSSTFFDSTCVNVSQYAGKTIKIMIPAYTNGAGTFSKNGTMSASYDGSTVTILDLLHEWELSSAGTAKTGELKEYVITLPDDIEYLYTSIFNATALAQGIGTEGFYCYVLE